MAYYLYKKIRDNKRNSGEQHLLNQYPKSDEMEAPDGVLSGASETSGRRPQRAEQRMDKEAQKVARMYRWRLIGGLFLPATVQALNTTLIAGALPFIASDFHQFAQINWIITAYNLTAAALIPLWGQFADIFGRYITLQASLGFMIFGSALCAGAPLSDFPMLLAGRGLEGVGAAGLIILMKIILADKVSLSENAKNNTIFTLVYGVGFSIGPVIGGYLTAVSWRWCFIINIPLAAVGLVVAHFLTRPVLLGPQDLIGHEDTGRTAKKSDRFVKRLSTVDFGGQLISLFGMGLLVLALTWAGSYYPWSDIKVIAPLVVGAVLMVIFFAWEYALLPGHWLAAKLPLQRAMIPLKLLWRRNAGLLMYVNFITGMAMFAVFYFVDLYFTIVKQLGSGKAGISLIFYTPGLGVGAYMAMFVCNSWPRKTFPPLAFGTVVEAVGITLLATALSWGHLPTIYGMLALTGVGTGIRLMPGTLHGVGYFRRQIASIVSIMNLAVSLGGTLASTIMLNIFNTHLADAGISLAHGASSSASSFSAISNLPLKEQEYLRKTASDGIVLAFYGISSFMWLGVIAVSFLGNVNIQKRSQDGDVHQDGETDVANLTRGSYIGSLFRRQEYRVNTAPV